MSRRNCKCISTDYSQCCLYGSDEDICGCYNGKHELYETRELYSALSKTNRSIVYKATKQIFPRDRSRQDQKQFICPIHRAKYTWEKERISCDIDSCQSKLECIPVGKNILVQIQKYTPYRDFPTGKFSNGTLNTNIIVIITCRRIYMLRMSTEIIGRICDFRRLPTVY